MKREHLSAILWLHWRLTLNRMRRRSPIGAGLTVVILISLVFAMLLSFGVSLALGVVLLDRVEPDTMPDTLMLAWDIIVGVFLLFWIIGVITELQRSEPLSLEKLLHLPVSLRGAFLINFVVSSLTLPLLLFGPIMMGVSLAMVVTDGPRMLVVLPLVASMLLMVTAITYQFRGWIAALMMNKRRRGTILAIITLGVIVLVQLPQLLNLYSSRSGSERELAETHLADIQDIDRRRNARQISPEEATAELTAISESYQEKQTALRKASDDRSKKMLGIANVIVPPGWLPIGVRAAAQGRLGLALWGVLGFMTLAAASLGRAYRTTIRLYTRGGGTRRRRATGTSRSPKIAGRNGTRFIERTIPGCSEPAAALALAGLRSFLRSPQSKMLLLTPVVFLFLAGAMFAGERREVSPEIAPLLALAVVGLTMFFLAHNFQNAFGFDRDGFRAIVLSGVPRRQILLGKNLALAPLALVLGGAGLTVLQFIAPMGLTHLFGAVLLLITGYLLCCVLGNVVSVLAPIGISSRTLKPVQPKLTTVIKQVLFFLLFPVVMTPIMIPYAVELGLETLGWRHGVPVFLLLSAVTLALTVWLYRWILGPEGRLLHYLEQHVLDVVTRTVD